jgi:hypothetical protein
MKCNIEKLVNPLRLKNLTNVILSHSHFFTSKHVPSGFTGMKLPKKQWFYKFLEVVTTIVGLFNSKSKNTSEFLDVMDDNNSIDIFEREIAYEGNDSIHVELLMNMNPSIKGQSEHSYRKQMQDSQQVVSIYPDRCLPFFAANPLDPNMLIDFYAAFGLCGQPDTMKFYGVKIYPSLGYLPSHPLLMILFDYCEKYRIPIISHCSSAGVKFNKYEYLNIIGTGYDCNTKQFKNYNEKIKVSKKDETWFKNTFNHPDNWVPVMEEHPRLKLDLAHFIETWWPFIIDLMRKYDGVYADISHTGHDISYLQKVNKLLDLNIDLRSRFLVGMDFYMVCMEGEYRKIRSNYQTYIDDQYWTLMSNTNPKKFIFDV